MGTGTSVDSSGLPPQCQNCQRSQRAFVNVSNVTAATAVDDSDLTAAAAVVDDLAELNDSDYELTTAAAVVNNLAYGCCRRRFQHCGGSAAIVDKIIFTFDDNQQRRWRGQVGEGGVCPGSRFYNGLRYILNIFIRLENVNIVLTPRNFP